ncbi:MAG: chemotaxis protein CheA [Thermodesulfobacteriota bacterium]
MNADRITDDTRELLPDYLADARECLEVVSRVLLAVDRGEEDPEHVTLLFRQMHIIKGGAGLMGFAQVGRLAHAAEDVLGAVKRGDASFGPALASALLGVHDGLRALLDELESRGETATDPGGAIRALEAVLSGETGRAPPPEPAARAQAHCAPSAPAPAGEEADEVLREFFLESWELIDDLDQDLVALEERPGDRELLNKIFRAAHTLKGSSSFLGFQQISEVTHRVEDIFNKLRRDEMALQPEVMDVILEAVDRVRRLLQAAQAGSPGPAVDDLLAALARAAEAAPATPRDTPRAEVSAAPVPPSPATRAPAGASAEAGGRPPQAEQTIRVDVERLDSLMNLVGELVLAKNRLTRLRGQMEERLEGESLVEDLCETSSQIDLVASDLQLAVMKTRLVPIDKVFRKFPRMVRDLSRSLGKEIRLEIQGENTELDKSVVEVIGDPLVHLIRNSADHGVEGPEARAAAGKSREGRIRLSACHEGNHIVVSVEDDGKGMDPEVLKRKAMEKGLVSAQEAASMSPKEAFNLVFAPGFSTAQVVTNVSGRGVGMDVVKTNIAQLNGLIEIDSTLGGGTRVDVRIPLTLAIIQALLVRTGAEVYAVPLVSVVETVRVEPQEIKTVDRAPVLRLRDRVVPLLRIDQVFGIPTARKEKGREYVVILGMAEKRVGLVVDALVGEEEVVIKSLGSYLTDTPGIAGATIRGDGRVTLIVDVNQLLGLAARLRHGAPARAAA